MNNNQEKIKELICNEYSRYTVEKYINKYGSKRFNEVKDIFAPVAADLIIQNCLNFQTLDEWEESKHPRKENGQFGSGGSSSTQNKKSNTIAGVKKGLPMSFKKADGGRVNPNVNKGGGYLINCQLCVAAFEARLRGYNIKAKPFDSKNPYMLQLGYEPNLAYIDKKTGKSPEFIPTNANNVEECEQWLKDNIKRNERYAIGYQKIETGGFHIIEVRKKINGDLEFYDPNSGEFFGKEKLKEMNFNSKKNLSPEVFRTDDKELNTELLNNIFKD